MDGITLPEQCSTMAEVRRGVDATDRELMQLLARRFGYMRAAARIKDDRAMVRDEVRKAEVIAKVCADAKRLGVPVHAVADLWEELVEDSISYELEEWDRLNR